MEKGMVLVMSLWDDHYSDMLWLDGDYPTNATASDPDVGRGTCAKNLRRTLSSRAMPFHGDFLQYQGRPHRIDLLFVRNHC